MHHLQESHSISRYPTVKVAPSLPLPFSIDPRALCPRGQSINTLAEDHGTEWFSDTSPAAVQRRQDEARASSIGLDALASRGGGGGGGGSVDGDSDSDSGDTT